MVGKPRPKRRRFYTQRSFARKKRCGYEAVRAGIERGELTVKALDVIGSRLVLIRADARAAQWRPRRKGRPAA